MLFIITYFLSDFFKSCSDRYEAFRKEYVLHKFSLQEQFWLDMTISIRVKVF